MSTIIYPENTSPAADAEAIRKACQGYYLSFDLTQNLKNNVVLN